MEKPEFRKGIGPSPLGWDKFGESPRHRSRDCYSVSIEKSKQIANSQLECQTTSFSTPFFKGVQPTRNTIKLILSKRIVLIIVLNQFLFKFQEA